MIELGSIKNVSLRIWAKKVIQTLPKALRTQALTALTSSFGLVWWVWFGTFGSVSFVS